MLVVVAAAVVGWPSMLPQCFPTSLSTRFMGQTGTVKHSAVAPGASPSSWTVTCAHGVLIRGGTFSGAKLHGACDGVRLYSSDFGTRTVTLLPGHTVVEMICAHLNTASWTYASSTRRNELDTGSAKLEADVLVVGSGLGGHAASTAVKVYGKGAATHVMVSPGTSTTAKSTGVLWFPLNHTYAELEEAVGFNETNRKHVEAYLRLGNESHAFWDNLLDLQPYPAPDYTQYSTGAKFGNTFQPAACGTLSPNGTCGAATLLSLNQEQSLTFESGTVTGLELTRSGFRVLLANTTAKLVRAVIFANGGSGRFNGFAADRILAEPENTGVHLAVAGELGLSVNSNRNLSWGLEFEQAGPQLAWEERWFSFGCAPAGVVGYAKCGDYNARTLSWPDHTPRNATVVNVSECSALSASYAYWESAYTVFLNATPSVIDAARCSAPGFRLATGMIDGKDGFVTDPETMAANLSGIYAAGTAGSYGLGNTYFGPGATLGWALHSGRLAGKAAAEHVAAMKLLDDDADKAVKAKGKRPVIIRSFRWGVWLLFVAVTFHVAFTAALSVDARTMERWTRFLGYAHYVLAPTAAAVVLWAAWRAYGQKKEDRLMLQIDSKKSKAHASLGRVLAWLLVLQVVMGITALVLNRCKKRSVVFAWAHRLLGWYVLIAVAGLYWTSIEAAGLHDDGVSKAEHDGQAMAYSWAVITLIVFSIAVTVKSVFCPAQRRKTADYLYVYLN